MTDATDPADPTDLGDRAGPVDPTTPTDPSTDTRTQTMLQTYRRERIAKMQALRACGIDPYPSSFVDKDPVADVLSQPVGSVACVAGRVTALRQMGNITFGRLHDESGDMQFLLSRRELERSDEPRTARRGQNYKFWVKQLDLGDIIRIDGERIDTKTGEPSIAGHQVTMLAKALRPLPDKHGGFSDSDERLRKRHLDILLHRDVQEMIYRKARFWHATRNFLVDRQFLEVQTPALELTTGGADARPFTTHHNYLQRDVNLRISMGELWQKRLLVGGLERVFEIGRQFRNEGQSREHLNDYDQMEFYWAYSDHEQGMSLVEELFQHVALETFGRLDFALNRLDQVHKVDLGQSWIRYDYVETVERLIGINVLNAPDGALHDKLNELAVCPEGAVRNRARAVDTLWKYCRKALSGPGFLINEPVLVSPLAKRSRNNPDLADRFHVIIGGSELGNGYSELNDPLDQADRFAAQQRLRDAGDAEAHMADLEFLEALEIGMPPAVGFGMSERVFAFLSNKSVRECQIFPLLKPRE